MNLIDVIKNGGKFKRSGWDNWYVTDKVILKNADENNKSKTLSDNDILTDDWELFKEKWYEGNFKEKYPNGILCWVWNYDRANRYMHVITDFIYDECPFVFDKNGIYKEWCSAEPVKTEDVLAIIGGKNA